MLAYLEYVADRLDLRADPIQEITPAGVRTATGEHPLDMLVLATGFDAISSTLLRLNPKGRGGVSLKEKWTTGMHVIVSLLFMH